MKCKAQLQIDNTVLSDSMDCDWADISVVYKPREGLIGSEIKHHKRYTHITYEFISKADMRAWFNKFQNGKFWAGKVKEL